MELTGNKESVLAKEKKEARALLWFYVRENISLAFKSSGLILWFVIFVLALLEIKQYYNIDVIPGYDSSVDDMYGAIKGGISEFFK